MLPRALAAALMILAPAALAQSLKVGDAAPPLQIQKWVKGDPVADFRPGHAYVVEFWGTTCGPCKQSIPHLSEMQRKYPGTRFVGVAGKAIYRDTLPMVESFVGSRQDQIAYAVAYDDGDKTDAAYMRASGQRGVPCAFAVDGRGKIAWIGHPGQIDAVVEKLSAEYPGVEPAAPAGRASDTVTPERRAQLEAKAKPLIDQVRTATEQKRYPAAITAIDRLIALEPALYGGWAAAKVDLLLTSGKTEQAALSYATRVVNDQFKGDAGVLGAVAAKIAARERASPKLLEVAVRAASAAVELTGGTDADALSAQAAAYAKAGRAAEAVESQAKAVALLDKDTRRKAEATKLLEAYRASAGGPGK
jgi:thiol-disulfide isomerase/thioredoxin